MDIREKLIELLHNGVRCPSTVDGECWDCPHHSDDDPCDECGATADMLIAHGVTVQEWISVEDKLPEEKGEYLVAYHPCYWDHVQWGEICVGTDTFRGKAAWAKKKFQRITHWMPMPEPPEEEAWDVCVLNAIT